ncbi:MAG: hypothetical protein ACRDRY_22290 [Pseudonocardiaceae bacterium]
MTSVAVPLCRDVPFSSMADEYPPPRNVRIDAARWAEFGSAVGVRKRSAWISDFIDAVIHAPQAWKEFRAIAEARGDTFSAALAKAIRLYRDAG